MYSRAYLGECGTPAQLLGETGVNLLDAINGTFCRSCWLFASAFDLLFTPHSARHSCVHRFTLI